MIFLNFNDDNSLHRIFKVYLLKIERSTEFSILSNPSIAITVMILVYIFITMAFQMDNNNWSW